LLSLSSGSPEKEKRLNPIRRSCPTCSFQLLTHIIFISFLTFHQHSFSSFSNYQNGILYPSHQPSGCNTIVLPPSLPCIKPTNKLLSAAADLHTRLICLNYGSSVLGPGTSTAATNDPATIAACNAYRRRNTGTKQWDTCPDCTVIQVNEIKECESKGKHLGGDE
jgi:hypothetical protein